MAFHTIWSVDLGKSALKAVKLHRDKNNVEILAVDKIDHPIAQNGVEDAVREALSIFRTRNDVREPVIVSHPGQGTFSRFIKVPAFDEKKVDEMVHHEASQQIPFPLDEVSWDYHVIQRDYLSGEEREVGLFAVRREAIDDFLLEFGQEGLSVEMLPIGYLALFNFIKYDLDPEEPSVFLDIGAAHTDLILIDGDRFWVRPLPHSGQDITKAIADRFRLKFSEAEKLKTDAAKRPEQAAKIFQAVIQPKLKELVQEVHRSIGYYRSQHGETRFQRLYLLGNGSRIIGIKKFLQDQLGMVVERMQSIQRLRINRDVNLKLLQAQLPAYGTALGAGLQALGVGTCTVDLVPKEEKIKKEVERKKKHIFIAAGILLLAMALTFLIANAKTNSVRDATESARNLAGDITAHEKAVNKIAEEAEGTLLVQRQAILRVAEERQAALEGLRLLEQILGAIPNDADVDVVVREGDTEAVRAAELEAARQIEEKLWLGYAKVERVIYPEEEGGTRRRRARRRGGAEEEDDPTHVPAYKFQVYAFVKMPVSEAEAVARIKSRLQDPLQQALARSDLTVVKEVTLGTGNKDHKAILVDPKDETGGTVGGRGGVEQEGRPFYAAPLTWYMVPRAPEKPAEEPAEPEE